MTNKFYKDIIFNSSIGYAYHEIIVNELGVPVNYRFIEVNPAFEKFTGLLASDIVGKTVLDVIPNIMKDDFDWISVYGDIAINGTKKEFESFSNQLKNWYKIEAYSPKINFFVTTFTNITKRQEATKNLEELSDMFASAIKESPIPIMIHGNDGKVWNISDAWTDMTGYTHDDIPTIKEWTKRAYGIKQKEVIDVVEQLYDLKERQYDGKFSVHTKYNTDLLWDFYSTYIGKTPEGIKMAMSVVIDVTESYHQKAIIEEQKMLFETTLLSVGDGVICTDPHGNITLINPVAEQLTGYKKAEAIGRDIEEVFNIFNEETGLISENIVQKVIQSGVVHELANHTILRCKNGLERPIADSAAPIISSSGDVLGVVLVFQDYTEKYRKDREIKSLLAGLQQTQLLLRASLDSPKNIIILSLDKEYKYLYFNETHRLVMKSAYDSDIQVGECIFDFMKSKDDINKIKANYDIALAGTSHMKIEEYGVLQRVTYEVIFNPIYNFENEIIGISSFSQDISDRLAATQKIFESEEKFRLLYSSMNQGLGLHEIILNDEGEPVDYVFLDINDSYTKLFGITKEMCVGKRITEVMPLVEDYWIKVFGKVAITGEPYYYENYLETTKRYYSTYTYSPKKGQFAVLVTDITYRIEREANEEYISFHDYLTGLYNRRFFEQELIKLDTRENLPLSLIMGDINGLKLVNDSFGHQVGDDLLKKVAEIIQEACRSTDIIARLGGDEFAIILPKTKNEVAVEIISRIKSLIKNEKVGVLEISVSFGHGTKTNIDEKMTMLLRSIEDEMYASKVTESRSIRSKTIDLIMKTLYEKNHREMEHSLRVSILCEKIAIQMQLDKDAVSQIKTAGLMHDIGKIAISEDILNKSSSLSTEEWNEVKRHSEIGYRILNEVNEFGKIANYVLEHHEKWDGTGYPKGLKAEEISLQARIINIADAYDAMTGFRTYRTALSKKQAIKEIIRCSGVQFDPQISRILVEQVLQEKWDDTSS